MSGLNGPITTRLLLQYGANVADWPAFRQSEAIRDMPEEDYTGRTLSRRYRYIGEHRQQEASA